HGPESYQPLARLVRRHFPEVELRLPRLAQQNNYIRIHYNQRGPGPLDIAPSGAGLRTFISLARILEGSNAGSRLRDGPEGHLPASQQAVVLDFLTEAAQGARQVILATHSPEIISRAPVESLRWVGMHAEAAEGGDDVATLLERLGASPELYLPLRERPAVTVY